MKVRMGTIKITSPDKLMYENKTYKCAIGLSGISDTKKENDGTTPAGQYNIRSVLYRPDRIPQPDTFLRVEPLNTNDVWCDNPKKKEYNLKVKYSRTLTTERLWRKDNLYDLILVIGYNDDPVIAGKGSAIFMHVAKPNYEPTRGCIALKLDDLYQILKNLKPSDTLLILNS
tara:strand:+ start:241 stop:756 length:516 start_codon:yes stop_codon:yes gene_type:complete